MGCLTDPDMTLHFSIKLVDIWIRLLVTALHVMAIMKNSNINNVHRHTRSTKPCWKIIQKYSFLDILSEMEEKDTDRQKEPIISQNKTYKDKQVFQEWLGLEIQKIHGSPYAGENLQFSMFSFQMHHTVSYQVVPCDPPLEHMAHLDNWLRETKNFLVFLANVRK
uniref:Kinetochore protein SPC25 n=1 Tax=Paramormyrops kingsleyae TaxID=1676925 RepID=A0A3B3Q8Y8_9TELE